MATAAEKLASNINIGVIAKAQELKKRIWFVVCALVVYRLGTYIPLPGINSKVLHSMFQQHSGGLLDMFNMFSGGALERMTIFALSVFPYITVSIMIQVLTIASPHLSALKKEGEAGRRKINQYTKYGAILMTGFQGYGMATLLQNSFGAAVINPGTFFYITTVVTLIGGTLFLVWLGEQMTARGIGNGMSLIIFTGIVAGLPGAIAKTFELGRTGALSTIAILAILTLALGLIAFMVFMERSHRRIVVQYPKRQVGNKLYGGESSHLPLKVNTAGIIPPIFASALLLFIPTIAGFSAGKGPAWVETLTLYLGHGKPLYITLYVAAIVFFCFFYIKNVFNPTETADNLKKNGGFIPGIRPGQNTAAYLDYVLTRITVIGAAYIAFVCAVPEILMAEYAIPFYLGGTSLLIVVNVTMDTVAQIQAHLLAHQYEGLLKRTKLKGRTR